MDAFDGIVSQRRCEIQMSMRTKRIEFPWQELSERSSKGRPESFSVFGYGSILDTRSAKRNIECNERLPAVAFGIRRMFDYQMPECFRRAWKIENNSSHTAALNASLTYDATDSINGVIVKVSESEIEGMREREQGYDLCLVPYLPWDEPKAELKFVHVLSALESSTRGCQFVRKDILPCDGYLDLCVRGARSYGEEFYEFFLDSTYLADGVTRIRRYVDYVKQGVR